MVALIGGVAVEELRPSARCRFARPRHEGDIGQVAVEVLVVLVLKGIHESGRRHLSGIGVLAAATSLLRPVDALLSGRTILGCATPALHDLDIVDANKPEVWLGGLAALPAHTHDLVNQVRGLTDRDFEVLELPRS